MNVLAQGAQRRHDEGRHRLGAVTYTGAGCRIERVRALGGERVSRIVLQRSAPVVAARTSRAATLWGRECRVLAGGLGRP
jgi:hypothetical protein